jgi:hypothetical protein
MRARPPHFVSLSCREELCGMCKRNGRRTPATHKVGEEIPPDAPLALRHSHNLTQYVCCEHFGVIMRPESARDLRACAIGTAQEVA